MNLFSHTPTYLDMGKQAVHVNLNEYQVEYFRKEGYNLSKVVRMALDDRMIQDGADPANHRSDDKE